jgi:hypothetical protein
MEYDPSINMYTVYHLHALKQSYVYPWIQITRQGSTSTIEAIFSYRLVQMSHTIYQRGNQNQYFEEEHNAQKEKEKVQKDKQRYTKHTQVLRKGKQFLLFLYLI